MQIKLPTIDLSTWRIWAAAAVTTGIVHIIMTFAVPEIVGQSAYAKLTRMLPLHRMYLLAPITATNQPLPFLTNDMRYAMCRFQTAQGSVSVSASLPDSGWTISILTKDGENTYAVAGQSGKKTDVNLLLVPPGERLLGFAPDAVAAQSSGVPLGVQVREGVVVIRAPIKGQSYLTEIEKELQRATCSYRRQ